MLEDFTKEFSECLDKVCGRLHSRGFGDLAATKNVEFWKFRVCISCIFRVKFVQTEQQIFENLIAISFYFPSQISLPFRFFPFLIYSFGGKRPTFFKH